MKALQVVRPRQFKTIETARPEIGNDQILVRLDKVVLCGSDIPKFTGLWPGLSYPLDPGMPVHECVGVVAESRSQRFQAGDHVVAVPLGRRGLAEYYVANQNKAIVIPETLVGSEVSLLIQPLSTVVYAFDRLSDIAGRTAVVVGLGPIGLLATWLLKQYGAGRVVGVDPIDWRCDAALRVGADRTYDVHSDRLVSLIAGGKSWEPVDICVETVGQQIRTLNNCLYLVKRGGSVLALGVPLEPVYPFEFAHFFEQNLQLISSVIPPDETFMIRAAELTSQHGGELEFLITHRFGLEKAAEAYTLYETRAGDHSLKVMIDGTDWPSVAP